MILYSNHRLARYCGGPLTNPEGGYEMVKSRQGMGIGHPITLFRDLLTPSCNDRSLGIVAQHDWSSIAVNSQGQPLHSLFSTT